MFAAAYAAQHKRIVAQLRSDPENVDWSREPSALAEQVLPFYQETAALAAKAALGQLPTVDFGLINEQVLALAELEAQRFAQLATNTSQAKISANVAEWIASGGTLDELITQVAAVWPGSRADVAAATEVTRLYAQGNAAAWAASEVVQEMEIRTAEDERVCEVCGPLADTRVPFDGELPPFHPGCRCWVVPIVKGPGAL